MSPKTHFIIFSAPWFGHNRPLFNFTMNLLMMYPDLYITYIGTATTSPFSKPPFENEMKLYELPDEARRRLRLTLLGEGKFEGLVAQLVCMLGLLPNHLRSVLSGAGANNPEDPFSFTPQLVVADILALPTIDILDSVCSAGTNPKIPAFAFHPLNCATVNYYWVRQKEYPETYWTPTYRQAEKELASGIHGDTTIHHVAYKVWCRPSDVVAQTVSLPPMYHYELNPQSGSLVTDAGSIAVAQAVACKQITDCMPRLSGFIVHTSPVMEPGEVDEMVASMPDKVFLQVGPQYPSAWWKTGIPTHVRALSDSDRNVMSFLDRMEVQYGKRSVLYISFGTTFLPYGQPKLFDAMIKTILAADPPLPFVFANADLNELLTPAHRQAIKKSDRGLLAGFVPQQALLKHDATGWYLCHSGSNSISEALVNEVPMVLWPYTIDQPIIANQLSVGLKIAFELIQVRTGDSIGRPTYRGPTVVGTQEAVEEEMSDIWKRMRGPEGEEIRRKVIAFRKAMKEDHDSGISRKAMDRFAEYMLK